ncbi:MAG: glycosyltransferase [Planctomycetaceae bacterium]
MKTLLLSEIFPPKTGGSGRWFWEIYSRMSRDEVTILAGEDARQNEFDATHDLDVVRAPLTKTQWGIARLDSVREYWRIAQTVRKLVKERGIQRLHCGRCLPEGWVAFLLKTFARLPYVCYVHGEDVESAATSRELSWMTRRVLNNADFLVANSQNTLRLLTENWNVPESKVRLLYPGVDTQRFHPAPRSLDVRQQLGWGERKVVLTVGRLQKRKGHDMLIRALPAIRQAIPDVLYAIAGAGDELAALQALVQSEGVADHVQFLGEPNDTTLAQCYQQCDLFVLANRQVGRDIEGFGMVLLEAQSSGRPVLAGASGGTAETMQIPDTGLVVPCEAPDQLGREITSLLLDDARRERMGQAARQWVTSRFDWAALSVQAADAFEITPREAEDRGRVCEFQISPPTTLVSSETSSAKSEIRTPDPFSLNVWLNNPSAESLTNVPISFSVPLAKGRIHENRGRVCEFQILPPTTLVPSESLPAKSEIRTPDPSLLSLFNSLRFRLQTSSGQWIEPTLGNIVTESTGPVRSTFRVEGEFSQCRGLQLQARLHWCADSGLMKHEVRIRNPHRASHKGGLWDLGDAGSILFKAFVLDIEPPEAFHAQQVCWSSEGGACLTATPSACARRAVMCETAHAITRENAYAITRETAHADGVGVKHGNVEIYQASSGGENWQSDNHQNRESRVPSQFRGYQVRHGDTVENGLRASPIMSLDDGSQSWQVAVPEFWQQFPKSLETDGRRIRVGLFPPQWGDNFELQGGEQKTHTVWMAVTSRGRVCEFQISPPTTLVSSEPSSAKSEIRTPDPSAETLAWVHAPVRATLEPQVYADANVFPWFATTDPLAEPLHSLLDPAIHGSTSLIARREVIDEYGWRNFGDVWADHEQGDLAQRPVISHYNNQFDMVYGAIQQFARTGDSAWCDLFDPLARHVADIDIYHTTEDRAAYNGGLFWHTDHYRNAASATHRCYSHHNAKPGSSYGGGPSCEHNYTTGLLNYYYLTGNLEAREAVQSLADWVVAMDDGAQSELSIVDTGPTGRATATASADYHGPGRGAGNSVNALLDGWLLTGDDNYLTTAESLIRRVIHPQEDIESLDLLNVEARWSYTVFLSVLARYLELKREAGQLDEMFAYGSASLRHFAEWMLANERPYFDHPEKLEYPTETWAAQEMRKANVLRLAAAHADEPLRSQLRQRGDELAARAWHDLNRFESRRVARAISIMMIEGTRDAYFRSHSPPTLPITTRPIHMPQRETFIPQKRRVLAKAKTISGSTQLAFRLVNPLGWPRLVHNVRKWC